MKTTIKYICFFIIGFIAYHILDVCKCKDVLSAPVGPVKGDPIAPIIKDPIKPRITISDCLAC